MRAGTRSSRTTFSMLTNHPWKPWWTAMSTHLVTNWSVFTWWLFVQRWKVKWICGTSSSSRDSRRIRPGSHSVMKVPSTWENPWLLSGKQVMFPTASSRLLWVIDQDRTFKWATWVLLGLSPAHREDVRQLPSLNTKRCVTYHAGCEHIKYQYHKTWRRDCEEMVAEVDKCVNIGPVPEVVTIHLFNSSSRLLTEKNRESRLDQIFMAWSQSQ